MELPAQDVASRNTTSAKPFVGVACADVQEKCAVFWQVVAPSGRPHGFLRGALDLQSLRAGSGVQQGQCPSEFSHR